MPLFSPDQTGLKPAEGEPEVIEKPAPRKRKAKTPEKEQPVANQPDDPELG